MARFTPRTDIYSSAAARNNAQGANLGLIQSAPMQVMQALQAAQAAQQAVPQISRGPIQQVQNISSRTKDDNYDMEGGQTTGAGAGDRSYNGLGMRNAKRVLDGAKIAGVLTKTPELAQGAGMLGRMVSLADSIQNKQYGKTALNIASFAFPALGVINMIDSLMGNPLSNGLTVTLDEAINGKTQAPSPVTTRSGADWYSEAERIANGPATQEDVDAMIRGVDTGRNFNEFSSTAVNEFADAMKSYNGGWSPKDDNDSESSSGSMRDGGSGEDSEEHTGND